MLMAVIAPASGEMAGSTDLKSRAPPTVNTKICLLASALVVDAVPGEVVEPPQAANSMVSKQKSGRRKVFTSCLFGLMNGFSFSTFRRDRLIVFAVGRVEGCHGHDQSVPAEYFHWC